MKLKTAILAFVAVAFLGGASDPKAPAPGSIFDARNALSGVTDLKIAEPATTAEKPSPLGASAQTMVMFALISLAPAAALMVTAFVRISIVLTLLRQALGSPQIPGNQVLTALALLLTAIVMRPVAESVYERGIRPYSEGRAAPLAAWEAGTAPIQGVHDRANRQDQAWALLRKTIRAHVAPRRRPRTRRPGGLLARRDRPGVLAQRADDGPVHGVRHLPAVPGDRPGGGGRIGGDGVVHAAARDGLLCL